MRGGVEWDTVPGLVRSAAERYADEIGRAHV